MEVDILLLTISLRCFYDSLLGSEVDELLYLTIELLNSSAKKRIADSDMFGRNFI